MAKKKKYVSMTKMSDPLAKRLIKTLKGRKMAKIAKIKPFKLRKPKK